MSLVFTDEFIFDFSKSIKLKEEQSLNIFFIDKTFIVSKLDIFNDFNEEKS